MASENETVADIVSEVRRVAHNVAVADANTLNGWRPALCLSMLSDRIEAAYEREKAKPVRNCDKYRTADDAYDGFIEFCRKYTCGQCRFVNNGTPVGYAIEWLYGYASKEAK